MEVFRFWAELLIEFALVSQDPPKVLFGVFVLYGLSGYVVYLVRKVKGQGLKGLDIERDEHF